MKCFQEKSFFKKPASSAESRRFLKKLIKCGSEKDFAISRSFKRTAPSNHSTCTSVRGVSRGEPLKLLPARARLYSSGGFFRNASSQQTRASHLARVEVRCRVINGAAAPFIHHGDKAETRVARPSSRFTAAVYDDSPSSSFDNLALRSTTKRESRAVVS